MWALIAGAALAQWTVTPLYVGTDVSGLTGDVANGVAITGWGPTNEVYFALNREVPDGVGRTSTLYVGRLACPGWAGCAPPALTQVGAPQADAQLPAVTMEDVGAPDPILHVTWGSDTPTCSPQVRSLVESTWDPATGVVATSLVHEPVGCADAQVSQIALADGFAWSCWTEDPLTGGQDNVVWCGTRPAGPGDTADTGAAAAAWTTSLLAAGVRTRDHSGFVVADGQRYLVVRDRDPAPDAIDLWVDESELALPDGLATYENDFPSIARAPDGTFHAVWVESRARITYARCVIGSCDDPASWEIQPRAVRIGDVDHPEIAIAASGRMFIVWDEDQDPAATDQRRIHMKHKCPTNLLFSPALMPGEKVSDIGASPNDQTLLLGRPRVWIDDTNALLHVAYLEKNHPGRSPTHGDALLGTRAVDPCP